MGNCLTCGKPLTHHNAKRCVVCGYLWHLCKNRAMFDTTGLPTAWCNTCKKETIQLQPHPFRQVRCLNCAAQYWAEHARCKGPGTQRKRAVHRKCLVCKTDIPPSRKRVWYCGEKCRQKAARLGIVAPRYDNEEALEARKGKKSMSIYQLTQQSGNKLHKLLDDILDGKTALVRHG